jgi:hypothetical protein
MLDQRRAMPQECAQDTHLSVRAKRRLPSAQRVELLEPLGIVPVRLASRHGLDMPRIDEVRRDSMLLKQLEDRHPIDPGRFHGDRVNVAGDQPVHQCVQIWGKGLKDAHRLAVAVRWHGDHNRARADVHPRSMGMDTGRVVPTDALGSGLGTRHGISSSAGICDPAQSRAVRSLLIGVVGTQVPQPPVQKSHVIGNHVGARARSLQCLGGSSLLVAG